MTDRAAVGRRSMRKGKKNERILMRKFTKWWGSEVRRTPQSGAYGGDWELSGDLMFRPDDPFPFHVEAKDRESWKLEQIFVFPPTGPVLNEWWEECSGEADGAGKLPMLVFTRNFITQFVALEFHVWEKLSGTLTPTSIVCTWWRGVPLAIVALDVFFELVKPDAVRALVPKPGMRYSEGDSKLEIDFR